MIGSDSSPIKRIEFVNMKIKLEVPEPSNESVLPSTKEENEMNLNSTKSEVDIFEPSSHSGLLFIKEEHEECFINNEEMKNGVHSIVTELPGSGSQMARFQEGLAGMMGGYESGVLDLGRLDTWNLVVMERWSSEQLAFIEFKSEGQSIADRAARVHHLAATCSLGTSLESNILDKFVMGLAYRRIKETLFTEDPTTLTFSKAKDITDQVVANNHLIKGAALRMCVPGILSCLGSGGCECVTLFLSSIENNPFLSMKRQELETLRGPQKLSQIQTSTRACSATKKKKKPPKKAHIFTFLRVNIQNTASSQKSEEQILGQNSSEYDDTKKQLMGYKALEQPVVRRKRGEAQITENLQGSHSPFVRLRRIEHRVIGYLCWRATVMPKVPGFVSM
uniref:Uncharacterized protein n=1 Tax=Timema genevievae TaxID=629358 RepID=A0A7R9JZJ9_TIMGE|nr:unnamed protein product [Timema genevievae]